ncbi:amidohydrolase family protein [Arthrobacter sp. zg-Y820]|uniref:N-acetylglucosamine-6-phosphate deacetylase n=1 Tax=unclassified Arthrobacter TaxID=235627 RepID=UPI0025416302|nr:MULTISPECIES: amidohydrolase family protein [unclassified Arthrobacter]MCC9195249.1 amidohydrolase family protein [Arthrobacter sp. zg-Y820]MDK1278108.1 amidohydrolase family protein [Arthrobacter sp. zg.Y820]WIB09998.1 amidohydrolase family protein [Arthrobacter sp. zg-Y820]
MTVIRGRILLESRIVENSAIAVAGGSILYAGPESGLPAALAGLDAGAGAGPGRIDEVRLPPGQLAVPGLIDLHTHGGYGVDFPSADAGAARSALQRMHAGGTTTVLASLVTAAPADLLSGLDIFAGLAEAGDLAGIHLEGPFLATARCGAQDPRWLRSPDQAFAADLIAAGRGHLRTMTYAPELPGSNELVDLLTAHAVVPSLGHTAATAHDAGASLARAAAGLASRRQHPGGAGAAPLPEAMPEAMPESLAELVPGHFPGPVPTVTHLFNGMDPIHHRSPGAVTAALRAARAGNAVVELIADNTHLDPVLVAAMFELLGAGNIALVTDAMAAAGLADGRYRLGPAEVQVHDGVARLASGAIAGGTASMLDLVRNAVAAGVPLEAALQSATEVPARVLGRSGQIGTLAAGAAADVLLLDAELQPTGVMRGGTWL